MISGSRIAVNPGATVAQPVFQQSTAGQKSLQVSVRGVWWQQLHAGYTRIFEWLVPIAPQLKTEPPEPPVIVG
jgi:hypothetical protein